MADEALSFTYRPKVRIKVSWFSWTFGVSYDPGANVWTFEEANETGPRTYIHLLEYPSFWYLYFGPLHISIAGRVPEKQEWQ